MRLVLSVTLIISLTIKTSGQSTTSNPRTTQNQVTTGAPTTGQVVNSTENPTTNAQVNSTDQPTTNPNVNSSQVPTSGPQWNSTQVPTSGPQVNSTDQPTTNPYVNSSQVPTSGPQVNSTQVPTSGPQVNSTQVPTSGPQVNSTQVPTSGPQVNSTQVPTSGPQVNSTQVPTSGSQVKSTQASTSVSQVKSTQVPTSGPQVNSTQVPTSGPQVNSTQVPTSGPQVNSTQVPTSGPQVNSTQVPTSGSQVKSTQASTSVSQVKSTLVPTSGPRVNSTQVPTSGPQVNSTQVPTTPTSRTPGNSSDTVRMRLIFRRKNVNFDIQFLNSSSAAYQSLKANVTTELLGKLSPSVTAVIILYVRPGSVEVTTILVLQNKNHVSSVEQMLNNYNNSGGIGNIAWVGVYWMLEDESCQLPEVKILNLGPQSVPSVPSIYRSKDFIVQASVRKADCNTSKALQFKWYLNEYTVDSAGLTDVKKITLLDTKTTEWNIPKRQLAYGQYFVDFKTAFSDRLGVENSVLGFFSIVKSPLIADIIGGNKVTRGAGSVITLNGSFSSDPDVEPGDHTAMLFTWLCKKKKESFPTTPDLDSIPVVTSSSGPGSGGCFGTGVGKLGTNSVTATINTNTMVVGETYDVRLIVTKDDRSSYFEQEIEIVRGDPPEVTIKCVINCGEIASLSTRISLTTLCTGSACRDAKYEWQLFTVDKDYSIVTKIPLTREMTDTKLNLTGIIIKENKLNKQLTYRLKVTVSPGNGPAGQAAYQFKTNAPPHSGQCTVTPTSGEALKTQFVFRCSGWEDNDKPLTYQFYYKTEQGLYTVVSYGSEDHVTTVLPQGTTDNMIGFEVMVADSLAAATKKILTVQVTPPPNKLDFNGIAVGNSSQLNELVQSGNIQAATQLANAVLETVDHSGEGTSTQDKITIKDSIVKQLSSVDVRNLQSLTQVTSAIARATREPNEVTTDSQRLVLQTLSNMTSLLKQKSADDDASQTVLVEQGGENLVLSLGNLLNSAAKKASVLENTQESEITREESKETSRSAEKLVDTVGTALLSKMIVDQKPRKMITNSLGMTLSRQSRRSLGVNSDLSGDDVGFKISLDAITDDRAPDAQYIDSVMTASAFNPFTWDNTSLLVSSHVVSLVLKNHEGHKLEVKDSTKDIELKIPRRAKPTVNDSFFIKPSSEGKMQYHTIKVPHAEGNTLRFKIKPAQPISVSVFVRYGQRPTVTIFDIKTVIPDESCTKQSQSAPGDCSEEAYSVFLSDDVISRPGTYFIGVLYDKDAGEAKTRKKRSCFKGRRQKRSCVEPKDPPKPENITVKPSYDPTTDMNYTMSIVEDGCMFWDSRSWSSKGCKAGPESNSKSLQCLCNHLTSFGGGLLVMPNKLDFDVVFSELSRLGETGNVAVLCAIIAALLIYFLVVLLARKADKRDAAKSGPAFQLNPIQDTTSQYDLTVVTGVWKESGTDSNVAMVIHGSEAQSQPVVLHKNMVKSRTILARGNEDSFVINLPMSLGEVRYIHVWHDNSGKNPSWFLSHVSLTDRQTGETWTFVSNSWFALEKGDGKIERILMPISPLEMKSFTYSINSRRSKSFTDGHLWLSVATKPPKSEFTRVQRATCCLCLLMSAMLVNAMFYRSDKVADPTIQVGPLKFSWRQIVVGIESALIVTPINLLIIAFFKNSAKKGSKKVNAERVESNASPVCSRKYSTLRCTESPSDIKLENNQEQNVNLHEEKSLWTRLFQRLRVKRKEDFKFPHFCIYIAWFLCFALVSVSSTITFFYSLQWGKDIANQWISSMLVSFTEDLFVLQPIKICLVMVLTACIIRSNGTENVSHQTNNEQQQPSVVKTEEGETREIKVELPNQDDLAQVREYKIKEAKMFSFGKELVTFLFFLLLLTIVCYGNRSQNGHLMTKTLKDSFSNFSLASDPRKLWKWLDGQFVSGIYAGEWYNKEKVKEEEYIGNKMSILLGMPRLRQLRVQKDSCEVPEEAQTQVKHCNDYYSFTSEDKTPLNLPGWRSFSGDVTWSNVSDLCPAPWRYMSRDELEFLPSWGIFSVYDGGGYVADLGYTNNTAGPLISTLRNHNWIDRQTRVVLVEFTVYNPSTGYLSICTYYYEILPTGYGNTFPMIETLLLTSTQTGFYQFYLICQLLFIVMVFYFVLREAYKVYTNKCAYFRDVWNWMELSQIIVSFLVVVFYIIKSKQILNSITKVRQNPFVTVSFQEAVAWNDSENAVLAVTIFIATVKLLRMIRFNPHVSILLSSFRVSRELLLSYSVIFFVIFLSYAQLGLLILGSDMYTYSTFQRTLFTELLLCLGGKMDVYELLRVNRILGPLFGFSFKLFMAFIVINFFVAILNDSYEDVKCHTDKQSKEFEMADFILNRLIEILGLESQQQGKKNDDVEGDKSVSSVNEPAENQSGSQERPRSGEHSRNNNGIESFSALAVNTHRLRMIRRKHLQFSKPQKPQTNSKALGDKPRKNKLNSQKKHPAAKPESEKIEYDQCKAGNLSAANKIPILVCEEPVLGTLDSLVNRQAKDLVQEDIELIGLIWLLCRGKKRKPSQQLTQTDVELDLLSITDDSPNFEDDEAWIPVQDYFDDEALELLKTRPSLNQLPHHLTAREQIRSAIDVKKRKNLPTKRKSSESFTPAFKYYPFV